MNKPNLIEIIDQIRNWQVEIHSNRNDGWTRAHYMKMLNDIQDGLSQAKFFRSILTGYLSQDPSILDFIDKVKTEKDNKPASKKRNKEIRELIKVGNEKMGKILLDENDIENIFDILEDEESTF